MKNLIHKVNSLLKQKRITVSVAESCSGGLLSYLLTKIPGSSKYFILGIVAYSNMAKQTVLKIPKKTLLKHGAVSKDVCLKMAKAVRIISKSDYGIGITGIAGPTGDTQDKSIGTVFISLSSEKVTLCRKFRFSGNRETVVLKTVTASLKLIKKYIA